MKETDQGQASAPAGAPAGPRHPSRLVAGLLSTIPGLGHMYLGLIGKGFALMGLLFLSVFVVVLYSDATGMYWMTAYLVPTLCTLFLSYAVFDSMAIARAMATGRSPSDIRDPSMEAIWEKVLLGRATIGWVLVIGGAIGLLRVFSGPIDALVASALGVQFPVMGLVIPAIMLGIGIRLLTRGARRP
jgi:TM2 domain-containing membrane protein YozV